MVEPLLGTCCENEASTIGKFLLFMAESPRSAVDSYISCLCPLFAGFCYISTCRWCRILAITSTCRIISLSKWLITMVSFRPLRIGLWDPFQMAELHGL